jgi:C-terminal processing protease CtpA/Prc
MLTDQTMGSAAQAAAWYAKETGQITLVGNTTGGAFGGPRTMAFMPNTGIIFYFDIFYITDAKGRPLEAGTIPHHFNLPGMDALETVLALIDEGNY